MGLSTPLFLLGLAGVGLPLYLHLLRRTATPHPFSSLLFFESRTQSAQRYRRLRYLLLLALRIAMLFLLALAFANPYLNRSVAGVGADRLVLLIIDHSFSMRAGSRLEDAKREAQSVLRAVRSADRVQVIAFGSDLQVLTKPSRDFGVHRAAVAAIQADDSRGTLTAVVNAVRQASDTYGTPVEAHLFSDLQQSNLPPTLAEMVLPDTANLVVHKVVNESSPNWTVESVSAPEQIWGSGNAANLSGVRAIVTGFSTPSAQRAVSLVINDQSVSTQQVTVPADGRVTVNFPNVAVPHGFSRAEVRIDSADLLPQDDAYRFAVERLDAKPALLIHAATDQRSPVYLGNALKAAEGSAFILQSASVVEAARLSLNRFAFVILSDIAALPPQFNSELLQYVQGGGSVLLVLGTGATGHLQIPVFGDGILETRDYGGAAGGARRFAAVADNGAPENWAGGVPAWSGVKFFYEQHLDAKNFTVLLRLTDGAPLLLERTLGEGRVVVLTSGLDGLTNDLPLHPVFVSFVARLARHLSGMEARGGARVVDSYLDLHTASNTAAGSGVEVVDPQGLRPLSLTDAAGALSLRLNEAGFYQVRLANGHSELLAVNPDRRESDLALVPDDILALWQRKPVAQIRPPALTPSERGQPMKLGWFILLLALAATLAQCWVADRRLASREEI